MSVVHVWFVGNENLFLREAGELTFNPDELGKTGTRIICKSTCFRLCTQRGYLRFKGILSIMEIKHFEAK